MKSHLTNILVVDDDPSLAEMLKIQLAKRNFKVRVAQNGRQAVQALKEVNPDLLLTDLFMDEMDGIELLTLLKLIAELVPAVPGRDPQQTVA